jgi:hypothetical protein
LIVKDANGNVLGTLVSGLGAYGIGSGVTIYKSGYFVSVNLDGTFQPSQIWWSSSTSCSGTPYLNDGWSGGVPIYYQTVAYSGELNSWYVVGGSVTKNEIKSVSAGSANHSIENSGNGTGEAICSTNNGANTFGGWPLSSFDLGGTLGWTILHNCSALLDGMVHNDRICVAGPLQLP